MIITLTYTTSEGKEKQVEFEKDVKKIWLGYKGIVNIDLAPLSFCTNLHELDLGGNHLQNIDINPLSSCTNLERLVLGRNYLQYIDLAPLSFCTNLHTFRLGDNQLQNIELAPLSFCTNLHELDLGGNHLQNIELAPLSYCTNLQQLFLSKNLLQNIDLAPLSSCTELFGLVLENNQLQHIDMTPVFGANLIFITRNQELSSWLKPRTRRQAVIYSSPAQLYPWSFLYNIIEQFRNDYRIQHDILAALDLADYGFIDRDLTDTLLAIAPETSTEDVREILIEFLVEEITAAVDRDGPTTGLNVEKLVTKHGEIVSRAQRILEIRKREIEQVGIHIDDNVLNLQDLWLTAYGGKILHALGMRLTTYSRGHEQIKRTFTELGHKLKTGDSSVSSANMSNEMKECIWWIAENRGKKWSEIEEQGV